MNLPSIGAYIDEAWTLYTKYFWKYARITIWYAIPACIGFLSWMAIPTYGDLPFVDNFDAYNSPLAITGLVVSYINLLVILPIITMWITTALIKFMQGTVNEDASDPSQSMNDAGRILIPVIGITLVTIFILLSVTLGPWIPGAILLTIATTTGGAVTIIGIIALIIGVLAGVVLLAYFGIRFYFAVYEVIFGRARVMQSLANSKRLVHGKYWAVFWRLIISGLILMIASMFLELPSFIVARALTNLALSNLELFERLSVFMDFLLSLITFMLFTPLSISLGGYVLYRHLSQAKSIPTQNA